MLTGYSILLASTKAKELVDHEPVMSVRRRSGRAGSLLTVYVSFVVWSKSGQLRSFAHQTLLHRQRRTSVTLPSPFAPRSPDLGFFPRTAISRRSGIELSRLGGGAIYGFVSTISGAPSGGVKVSWLSVLRCRFAFGWGIPPSFERGRCLRRLLRTEPVGALFAEGENIVSVSSEGNR